MKKQILFLILVFGFSIANCQKLEVKLIGGIGISESKLKQPTIENRSDHKFDQSLYNTPIYLDVNYFLLKAKRMSLYLGTGVGFQKNNYYQNLTDKQFNYLLESVKLSEEYFSIPFNLGLEVGLNENLRLGVQYGLNYDTPLITENQIEYSHEKRYKFIDYNYILNHKMESSLNHNISFFIKTVLSESLNLVFDFGYNISKNGTYSYNYFHKIYSTNQDTGVTTSDTYNYQNSLEEINHNFLTFKMGVSKILLFNKD